MEPSQLEERLASIELRLSRIESGVRQPASPARAPVTRSAQPQDFTFQGEKPGSWLGLIAVACFVLAAGFIIKLSIESGWLTPERQIGLAALLGASLIGAGFALMRSDRVYAALLPGAGVIVLYLTTFAAHRYYGLISFELAIAITGLISGLCIWLYMQFLHDVYAVTAAAGAYLAPVVLDMNADAAFSLYYFLLCSVAFATISIWVRSRTLTLVSSYLALLMSSVVGTALNDDMLVASMLALYFLVFSLGTYLYTVKNSQPLSEGEAWGFLPVLLLFYAMEYYFIERIHPGLAPWISLGFSALLMVLYLSAKEYFPDGLGSRALIFAFVTITCFHSVYLELLPVDVRPWLFVLIMLGAAFSPVAFPARGQSSALHIPFIALLAIVGIEYLKMVSHLLHEADAYWLMVSFAAFASIWVALLAAGAPAKRDAPGIALLGAAHVLAILGFYRLTHDISSLAVSASWLLYAVCVIIIAFVRKDEAMARSALFVLAFAAGKALLYDAASAPTVLRILCLLLTGAVLYGCGFLMRKFTDWTKA